MHLAKNVVPSAKRDDLPPQITGPARVPIDEIDHSIPSLIPNSLVGLIAPVLAATSEIQAPLVSPYAIIPTTTAAGGIGAAVQNAKREMAQPIPIVTYIFHTPKVSARMPETTRPKNDPVCMMAMEYSDMVDERLLEVQRSRPLKKGLNQLS